MLLISRRQVVHPVFSTIDVKKGNDDILHDSWESFCSAHVRCNEECYQGGKSPFERKNVALYLCNLFIHVNVGVLHYEFSVRVLQSTVSIVNTVMPVLGGIVLDAFGTATGSLATTMLIAGGNILVAMSTGTKSLSTMITGRILYGVGCGTVVIAH